MADLADDSDSDGNAVINLTQVVTVGGLKNPNQNAVGGPVRLHCSSAELTAEASFGDFALGATRFATRAEGVVAGQLFFSGQNRTGKVSPTSGKKRVVIACGESFIKAPPRVGDKVQAVAGA